MHRHGASPFRDVMLLVGRDPGGHWLAREARGDLEGRFIFRDAALDFARRERHAHPSARVELADHVLTSRLAR